MRLRITLFLAFALLLSAQWNVPPGAGGQGRTPEGLGIGTTHNAAPNAGCAAPSDEILKADYQKSLDDARELSKLADDLKNEFEKNDPRVMSLATLKKSEDIEKISKRIHSRLKRCW